MMDRGKLLVHVVESEGAWIALLLLLLKEFVQKLKTRQ